MTRARIKTRWAAMALIAIFALAHGVPASAQWKWRDKSGQTQYSDLPPPAGTPDKDILQRPAANRAAAAPAVAASTSASGPALTPKLVEPELEAKRKKVLQEADDKKKADEAKAAAARADNCAAARAQLRDLDSGARLARTNEKGEREVIDDAARAAAAKRSREIVASDCQ